ncbi:hypothetical protein P7L68_23030 [Tistrella mobilis]|jgi:hypothetical protein|uniref:hypothetical protein n=1 Tax=Tistrella mobilis TaxID=171437 RepID=UPI003556DAA8
MISTSQLMALASDPATAAALIAAMTPEEAARILGETGDARGFRFDWRALIPRLKRRTDDAALDDAALEGVAGGAASAAMILPGGWTFGG